jgi:hypothetical protein
MLVAYRRTGVETIANKLSMNVDFSQYTERVMNELQRARFSCGRIIRLHPPAPRQ